MSTEPTRDGASPTATPPLLPETTPASSGVWPMYRALVGVGLLCGLLIVSAYEWTKPIIEKNRAEALRAAIFRVLPGAESSATFALQGDGSFVRSEAKVSADVAVHAGYDADGRLVGLAIEASGMGYQDTIGLLYGYSLDADAVVGIQVLDSRETPGLGDKIEKDPTFLANFERLDASLTDDGAALQNPIVAVKHGTKTSPWQVDAITGATISSNAIADILRASTTSWVPRVEPRAADFER